MATAAGANITTIAGFPEHIFLENLAVRADGSILVSALNREHTVVRRRPRRPAAARAGLGAYLRRGVPKRAAHVQHTFPTPGRPR
jgi:hypothetical protein